MPKKAGMEAWKKKRRMEYLEKREYRYYMGYVFLIERNSPVESEYVLESQRDIDDRIHFGTNNNLTIAQKDKIVELLS